MTEANPGTPETINVMLTSIVYGARDTNIYSFAKIDGSPLPGAGPGAHIGLFLPNGVERQYSLIDYGEQVHAYRIAVKRDARSRGGSMFMHDSFRVGSMAKALPPRNGFPLKEDAELIVLFAGGIGITPIYCMLKKLKALNKPWQLYYSSRARMDAVFLNDLQDEQNAYLHFDDEKAGEFLQVGSIIANLPKSAHLYCCGPSAMLAAFEAAAAASAFPSEQVHVEYFTPKFVAAQDGGFVFELASSKREFTVPAGKTILQVVREAGIQVPYSCEEGVCGACETRVISGTPDHRDSVLTEREREEGSTMMICCSGSKSPRLVLDM